MQKPNGYDEVQVGGDFTPIALGGHHMTIKAVREQPTKDGKPMIVVAFDFAKNDNQPGYFSDQFDKDIRPEKKWPFAGTSYIMTQDWQDPSKVSKKFKSFITSFERSNNVQAIWGETFCEQFKGKKIGGVFAIEEEEYNGEIKKRHKLRYFCDDNTVDGAKIPEPKLLKSSSTASTASDDGFVNVPVGSPEEIPF